MKRSLSLKINLRRRQKRFLSAIQAHKLLANGCITYLANIVNRSKYEKSTIDVVPIAKQFREVFPNDLTSLLPNQEINFEIELLLGTIPIFNALYRMIPTELRELHEQLQELLKKGFIRPSQ